MIFGVGGMLIRFDEKSSRTVSNKYKSSRIFLLRADLRFNFCAIFFFWFSLPKSMEAFKWKRSSQTNKQTNKFWGITEWNSEIECGPSVLHCSESAGLRPFTEWNSEISAGLLPFTPLKVRACDTSLSETLKYVRAFGPSLQWKCGPAALH